MRLKGAFEKHGGNVQFFTIYIEEAHPADGWALPKIHEAGIEYTQPTTTEARAAIAEVCAVRLDMKMPMLLDNMENEVDVKYAALPERLYVLDKHGNVYFRAIMGSRGFDVDAWLEAVQAQAAVSGAQAAE